MDQGYTGENAVDAACRAWYQIGSGQTVDSKKRLRPVASPLGSQVKFRMDGSISPGCSRL